MFWLLKRKRRFVTGLAIAIVIGSLYCLISHFDLFHGMQQQSSDILFKAAALNSGSEPADDIVIIGIDDRSLDELGRFSSWPRSYHAHVVDALAEAGARVIVFDILFSEPSPDDELLAASIGNAGNVILPFVFTTTPTQPTMTGAGTIDTSLRPLPLLEERAAATGHAAVLPDEDGIVRKLPAVITASGRHEPSLALAAAAGFLRRPTAIEAAVQDNTLPFAGRAIPLDDSGSMLINYTDDRASSLHFETISYVDAMRGGDACTSARDRIAFIGATATGLGDTFFTPTGRQLSGVEIHAGAMQTILSGHFLRPATPVVTTIVLLLIAALCGLAVLRLSIIRATTASLAIIIGYFLIAFYCFDNGILLDMLYPPVTAASTFAGLTVYTVVCERMEKSVITRTFGRYISPPVAETILSNLSRDGLEPGGEVRTVTVLFVDARNFTGFSEKMLPAPLIDVLNSYMTVIIESVLKHDGIVNKFGGDSIMAIWNAPHETKDHAVSATMAAIHAQQAITRLNSEHAASPILEFGIGVNTGDVFAGNMGSGDRLEYTVIGDAVNVAARLAGAAPGGRIWIGADTRKSLPAYITTRQLDPVFVKGRQEPVYASEIGTGQESAAHYFNAPEKIQGGSVTNYEGCV